MLESHTDPFKDLGILACIKDLRSLLNRKFMTYLKTVVQKKAFKRLLCYTRISKG